MNFVSFPPIAMFHHVSDRDDWKSLNPFKVRQRTFSMFLDSVEEAQLRTTTFRLSAESEDTSRSIHITFDDCGKHLLDWAVPELQRRKMVASFFMPTAHLGGINQWDVDEGRSRVDLMNESDLLDLHRAGMEIGGHSHRHVHLGRLDSRQVSQELSASSKILESIIGTKPVSMAYPFGSIPENTWELLSQAGYEVACSIFSPKQTAASLRRFIVHDGDTERSLRMKLTPLYRTYRSISDPLKPQAAYR
jgi:peptidoglycan/xylan/chitin deacetylase (PgdA/CDA1 family)